MSESLFWIAIVLCNVPVCLGFGWLVFRNWENFWEAVRASLMAQCLTSRPKSWRDVWVENKLSLWVLCCGLCLLSEICLAMKILLR